MKNEEMVCSIEQAKALEKLGVKIETYFVWIESDPIDEANTTEVLVIPRLKKLDACSKGYNYVSFAPNVAELGEIFIKAGFQLPHKEYDGCFWTMPDYLCEFDWDLYEAQARAESLIWLIENKYIKVEDLRL